MFDRDIWRCLHAYAAKRRCDVSPAPDIGKAPGLKRKKEKGFWDKRSEHFDTGAKANRRAAELRTHEHVAHVLVDGTEKEGYVVSYSVAKWYLEELKKAGVTL